MISYLILVFFLIVGSVYAQSEPTSNPDDALLDATYVPCNDSTASIHIFQDGRVVYTEGNQGTIFTISGALLSDLQRIVATSQSTVDTKFLDSCTTLGVVLDGPRYLLINDARPTPETTELQGRLDRLRKFARRKLQKAMEKLVDRASASVVDTSFSQPQPEITPKQLQRYLTLGPIAREWKCRGTIVVSANIDRNGHVRDAFVKSTKVHGKCTALLSAAALRSLLLATFDPVLDANGRARSGWTELSIVFRR